MSKEYSEEEKRKYVEGFKNSTNTLYEYSKKNNILPSYLRKWLKEEQEPKIGALDIGAIFGSNSNNNIKFESNSIKIELKENYDKDLLRRIIGVILNV